MKRTLSALLVSSALLCAAVLPTMAAESADPAQTDSAAVQEETMSDSELYYGQVQEIGRDEAGTITSLLLTSERYGEYVMNISGETVWIDSGERTASDPATLQVGESVYVYHSPVSTRSLPPQSPAFAVVRNVPQDVGAAKYLEVEAVTQNEDGSATITTNNGGLWLTVEADASVTTYAGEKASLADLQVGSHVMAWYDIVLLSYPGQAGTDQLMLLPGAAEERDGEAAETSVPLRPRPAETTTPAEALQDGTELSIVLEGDMVLPVTGKVENGAAMVPVAAVAQALGYEVTYTPGENGEAALVTVEDDSFRVNLNIGDNLIQGVTKIEGAVGMTSPMDYGMAPYIVEPGTTWAPAQLFEMLGRTVTVDGDACPSSNQSQNLYIQSAKAAAQMRGRFAFGCAIAKRETVPGSQGCWMGTVHPP